MLASKLAPEIYLYRSKMGLHRLIGQSVTFFIIILVLKWWFFLSLNDFPAILSSTITIVGFLLTLSSFVVLLRSRRYLFFYILNLIISVVLFANTLYLDYFGSAITIYTFLQVNNLDGLGESIFSVIEIKYFIFFIDLALLPLLFKITLPMEDRLKRWKVRFVVFFLSGFLCISFYPWKMYSNGGNPLREFRGTDNIVKYSILGHHFLDIYEYVSSNKSLSNQEIEVVNEWFDMKNEKSVPAMINQGESLYGFGKNKNLILIQTESLQNFVINKKVMGQEVTPNLNRMLENSIYFPNFYPQTIEGNSSDAEFLTQTSLYPISKGAVFFRYPSNEYVSLGNILKEEDYSTLAIHADEATFWNRDQIYPNLGFDEYKSIKDFKVTEQIGMGLSDEQMFHQSIDIFKKVEQPFYSLIITLTSHVPFKIPEKHQDMVLSPDLNDSLLGRYFQSVRYTDNTIGLFLDELEKANLLENSIIVIYGDHDGIFEKDKALVENLLKEGTISKEQWIREYIPVPLIIYNPNIEKKVDPVVGGQIDLLPTLAYIMGIEPGKLYYTMGENLLWQDEGVAIIPKGDYSRHPSYSVTKNRVYFELNEEQKKVLEVSNLIIQGNYFAKIE